MIDLEKAIMDLEIERPVFHSEADFQHSLAWKIHQMYPRVDIRLEKPFVVNSEKMYFDIVVLEEEFTVPIELKYKTRQTKMKVGREEYQLKNQGAQDQGRYDFLKDISRIEKEPGVRYGFGLFLTNDPSYWEVRNGFRNTVDSAFRIHEGRNVDRKLAWTDAASAGTMGGGRDKAIDIRGKYLLNWKEYSQFQNKWGRFRYLLVKVERPVKLDSHQPAV